MQDYLIVANGPFVSKSFIQESAFNKQIIALDGAVNSLLILGIQPNIILGDFDSITTANKNYYKINSVKTVEPYFGRDNISIVPALDQNFTDLEKAIQYCDDKRAESISIICATGGRLDHHEALRLALKTYYQPQRKIIVHAENGSMCFAKDEDIVLSGMQGDNCGFIGYNHCEVDSQGLEYECVKLNKSIANKMLGEQAFLQVKGEALVFLPPQLAAQRK